MRPDLKLPLYSVMTVDPGLGGTGWAYWSELGTEASKRPYISPLPLIPFDSITSNMAHFNFGVERGNHKDTWQRQAHNIAHNMYELMGKVYVEHLIIEYPSLWSGSAVSHAAVSGDESNLSKMHYLIGGICALCWNPTLPDPILITPQEWKGQLPKSVVIQRILRCLPAGTQIPDHAADAVGMGFALQGML